MSRRPYGDFDGWRGDRGRDGADAEGAYRNDSRYVVSATGSGSSQQSDQEARIKRLEDEVRRLSALLESKEVENNQHHVRIQLFSGGAKGKIKGVSRLCCDQFTSLSHCLGVKQQVHQEREGHRTGDSFDRARSGSHWPGLAGDRRWAGQQDREWHRGECVVMCHDAFCRCFHSRMAPRPGLHAV